MGFDQRKSLIGVAIVAALSLIIGLSIAIPLSVNSKENYLNKAKEFLRKNQLIDGHNDLAYLIRENFQNQFYKFDFYDMTRYLMIKTGNQTHTDLKRLKEGRIGGQFWSIYANCSTQGKDALMVHLEQIDSMQRIINKFPEVFQFTVTATDVRQAFKNGKIASMFGLESGHAIDSSLAILRIFYSLGVRYMTLTHNCNTPWADNHLVDGNESIPRHNGLTDFGKKVIKEMNRLGMIVDLSHTSYKTMLDTLEITKAPVIFSHSSVYSICNNTRNVRDDVLMKLKENKGVIMINFFNYFLTCSNDSTIDDVKRQINYVKNKIGVDYIGIGADYDGISDLPTDLNDVSKYPNLFASLLEDGWSEEDLAKIAGENILRVMEDNENYATSVRYESPNDDIIDSNYIKDAGLSNCRSFV